MNKKSVLKEMIEEAEVSVFKTELREKFLQRARFKDGSNKIDLLLGQVQTELKGHKQWLKFLQEKKDEEL